jgi:phytoene dehydrogenase-like protein
VVGVPRPTRALARGRREELGLRMHVGRIVPYGGGVTFTRNGDILGGYLDKDIKRREIARHSPRDADAYLRYSRDTMRQCRLIRALLMRTPPDPSSLRWRNIRELLHLGREFAKLGEAGIYDTIRFYTLSIADYLNEYFESDVVKATFAGSGIIGTALGVQSPGTAYVLLHHYMGDVDGQMGAWGFARGGMGAVSAALAGALQAHGGEIRTDARVQQILVRGGRTTGVALANGDEYQANLVVSNLDPKRTFLKLFDPRDLQPELLKSARNFKIRGSSGKLNIALDGLPDFPALGAGNPLISGDMHFLDSMERYERAYDDWKNGTWSKDPYLDLLIPSVTDPTMAPPGKHMMSVFVQYVPPLVNGREWTDADREAFKQTVFDQIGRYSPNFRSLVLHAEVRTPRELEAEVGLTEGNIFQGELTFDQLFFNRPVPGYAQYRGPVRGLYMCGSATHPGGGVMAAPGANAAREILRDLGRDATVPDGWSDD